MNIKPFQLHSKLKCNLINTLIISPQYKPNLSNIIRSAEFFGLKSVFVYDAFKLLKEPENKSERADRNKMARVWTAGAAEFIDIFIISNLSEFLMQYPGRRIATVLEEQSIALENFTFQENDLLIFGNEKVGIPQELFKYFDQKVTINSRGNTDCLNISTSFGVFMYKAINDL